MNLQVILVEALISHPRELIPPFTHQMMKEACLGGLGFWDYCLEPTPNQIPKPKAYTLNPKPRDPPT